MEETYCPICFSELNNLTRPKSSGTLKALNKTLFVLERDTVNKCYCPTCRVELWFYPEENKEGIQHKDWYVHVPLKRIAVDHWAEILHEEAERKVFTLIYAL